MEKENNIQLVNFTELFLSSAYLQQSKILRVEKIRIPFKHAHFEKWLEYCFLAKNLYNTTLYHVYGQFNQNKTLIKYENLAKQFVKENNKDFRALNNNAISQQIMMMVFQNFKSYFALLKKNKGKTKTDSTFIKAKPPKYYPKKDLGICRFACPVQRILKQKFKKTGKIQLSGLSEEIAFQSKIINSLEKFDTIQQIRVVPNSKEKAKCTYIDIELIYDAKKLALLEPKFKSFKDNQNINQVILEQFEHLEEKVSKNKKEEQTFTFNQEELIALNQRLCGVDLNLNQIALSFTQNQQDIKNGKAISSLFNIKPLKSINRYYNKRKAKLQSRLDDAKNKLKDLEDRSSFYYGYLHEFLSLETIDKVKDFLTILVKQLKNKIKRLTTKRNDKIKTLFHILSKNIIQHCLNLKVNTIVIGKNQNFKKMINLGQVNNQNFSLIPYNLFINFVKYKALSKGINFILVEESYTSKTSFLDKEILYSFTDKNKEKPEDYKFLGKRIKRGLFQSKENKLINADVNGAYNIIRKVFGDVVYNIVNTNSIVASHPSKYCIKLF